MSSSKREKHGRAIVWFRSDLRTHDNPALHEAIQFSKGTGVIAVFFMTPTNWKEHNWSLAKVNLLLRTLSSLSRKLKSLNIPLIVEESSFAGAAQRLLELSDKLQVGAVFANKEYEVNEGRRDEAVKKELVEAGITFCLFEEQCVVAPDRVKTLAGKPYCVFTPFKNAWIKYLESNPAVLKQIPEAETCMAFDHEIEVKDSFDCKQFEIKDEQFKNTVESMWDAGEESALKKLSEFAASKIQKYKEKRDFPSIQGTSELSPYLSLGILSAKTCLNEALKANNGKFDGGNENVACWISEICWREFYRTILFHFPRVCMNQPFNLQTKKVEWLYDEQQFNAWKEGRTGYPIVDAGMRQLKATGYMHNRLRMITAMFLTKHLLMNWQLGEAYFMSMLVDGDFSSNNGGWQWSASTGTDSQPYFRVFNPKLQSERFDKDGIYIKKWVPELKKLSSKQIHDPSASLSPGELAKIK